MSDCAINIFFSSFFSSPSALLAVPSEATGISSIIDAMLQQVEHTVSHGQRPSTTAGSATAAAGAGESKQHELVSKALNKLAVDDGTWQAKDKKNNSLGEFLKIVVCVCVCVFVCLCVCVCVYVCKRNYFLRALK